MSEPTEPETGAPAPAPHEVPTAYVVPAAAAHTEAAPHDVPTAATPPVTAASGAKIPQEIWTLIAAAFVIAIGFGLITPVLPQFATSFGVGATASSIVVSAFAFFRLVFAPAGGRLISRLGERPIYLTGLIIVAVSTGATAFAQNYWQLLLFRGLGGIGSTMFTVSAIALLVRLAPTEIRARVTSAYASAFLLGGIGGPIVGGFLGNLGLRVPFLAYAVALLIAAAIVAVRLSHASLQPPPGTPVLPPMTALDGWRDSAYRAALFSSFANGWSNFGIRNAILPLFAAFVVAPEPWVAGTALAVFAGGNAIGLTHAGRRSDDVGRKPFIISGLIVSGIATGLTGYTSTFWLLMIASAIAGFGAGTLNPAQQASVADVIGRERNGGPALAAFQMASDLGTIIGPILAGVLIDRGSFHLAFGVTGIIVLLAAIPWLRARETRPRATMEA